MRTGSAKRGDNAFSKSFQVFRQIRAKLWLEKFMLVKANKKSKFARKTISPA
jgi:hypothetical protein